MVLAGLALRQESGVNFQAGGDFQKWIVWSVILLTLPQLLAWFAAQGINMPSQAAGQVASPWLAGMETSFKSFVTGMVLGKLVPVLAAWFVLKAALDASQGENPLGSIVTALFLLTVSSLVPLLQSFNSGTPVCHGGHAGFALELRLGNNPARGGRTGSGRRGHQLRAAQADCAAHIFRIGFLERLGALEAGPGNGWVKQWIGG